METKLPNKKTFADLLADTENTWDYTDESEEIIFIETRTVNGQEIRYRYIAGNDKIVYFRACTEKLLATYENMYSSVAKRIHEKYGCSVIICSYPTHTPTVTDKALIDDFVANYNIANPELFFLGHSKGCITGLKLASEGIPFKRIVMVNARLKDDLSECIELIKRLPGSQIDVIHDIHNPSYSYLPILEEQDFKTVKIIKTRDLYHSFKCAGDRIEP